MSYSQTVEQEKEHLWKMEAVLREVQPELVTITASEIPGRLSITDRLRLQSVKRWHIVPTVKEQTVADHVYGVMQLGCWMARELGLDVLDQFFVELLDHDIEEVITGDVPASSPNCQKSKFMDFIDVLESALWLRKFALPNDRQAQEVCSVLENKAKRAAAGVDAEYQLNRKAVDTCQQLILGTHPKAKEHFLGKHFNRTKSVEKPQEELYLVQKD